MKKSYLGYGAFNTNTKKIKNVKTLGSPVTLLFWSWAEATMKGLVKFQNKKFWTTFHHQSPKMLITRPEILIHLIL